MTGGGYDIVIETGYDEAGQQVYTASENEAGTKVFTNYEYDPLGRLKQTYFDRSGPNDKMGGTSTTGLVQ